MARSKSSNGQKHGKLARKRITVHERKLGKEKAVGLAYYDFYGGGKSLIEIDPRQGSKDYLDTLIHEALHTIYPDMSETEVHKTTGRLARLIWRQGYRRIQE